VERAAGTVTASAEMTARAIGVVAGVAVLALLAALGALVLAVAARRAHG
jgi:hypothetical protein